MDFRVLDAGRLTWMSSGRVAYGAGRFTFQTPPAVYEITPNPRLGDDAADLVLHMSNASPLTSQFASFVRSIEASAQRHAGVEGRRLVETMSFHNGMRLTLFKQSTAWFAKDGSVKDVPVNSSGTCMALLELTGYWTSAASWGLKFKVIEAKDTRRVETYDHGYAFLSDE